MNYENVKTMEIVDNSEKALLLKGNTKPHKEELKAMHGCWSHALKGWLFSKKRREELEAFVEKHTDKRAKQLLLFDL